MKRLTRLLVILAIVAMGSSVSAYHNWGGANDPYERGRDGWQRHNYAGLHGPHGYNSAPFSWHQRREDLIRDQHHFEAIHDREWDRRFPGLHVYRWYHDSLGGFWYQGYWVANPIFFFDNDDELVSFGFWHNGTFVMFRDDGSCYENHDDFFISWWGSFGRISFGLR